MSYCYQHKNIELEFMSPCWEPLHQMWEDLELLHLSCSNVWCQVLVVSCDCNLGAISHYHENPCTKYPNNGVLKMCSLSLSSPRLVVLHLNNFYNGIIVIVFFPVMLRLWDVPAGRSVFEYVCVYIYRVSQEECARLRKCVPYVKLYRYNPKPLYPKLNGYGDNGQKSLKLWQLLLNYWLPNTYWNWKEYVVSVMLIAVRSIKVTCEWHKAIKLNYKNTRTRVIVVLRLPGTLRRPQLICYLVMSELPCAVAHTPRSLNYDV